jgi:hypothetical protein
MMPSMPTTSDIFHIGFVVPNIEEAQAQLGAALDLTWTDIELREMPVVGPNGRAVVPLRFVYSTGAEPRLELMEPIEGTVWRIPTREGALASAHHIGVWCDDLAEASARLVAAGMPLLMTYDDGSGDGRAVRFAYHQLPTGPLVELVDMARRPVLEAWFRGEDYPMYDAPAES